MSKDLDELTVLNRDYVASVQNCDVKRFDEILAQDFYCTNPDKSLVDRTGLFFWYAVYWLDELGAWKEDQDHSKDYRCKNDRARRINDGIASQYRTRQESRAGWARNFASQFHDG